MRTQARLARWCDIGLQTTYSPCVKSKGIAAKHDELSEALARSRDKRLADAGADGMIKTLVKGRDEACLQAAHTSTGEQTQRKHLRQGKQPART